MYPKTESATGFKFRVSGLGIGNNLAPSRALLIGNQQTRSSTELGTLAKMINSPVFYRDISHQKIKHISKYPSSSTSHGVMNLLVPQYPD